MAQKEIQIRISSKDLSAPEFAKAKAALSGIGLEANKVNAHMKTTTGGVDGLRSALGPLAAALSVGAIVSFGKDLIGIADGLAKMSAQTGIGTDALQWLQEAANRGGNTLEEVTKSINKMQIGIAGQDKGAMQAIKALGLSFTDLRSMKPEDQFSTVAAAIAKVEDPADRSKLAMLMFGRQGTQIAGTLAVDMQSVKDSVTLMSEDSIQALDRAGDELQRMTTNIKATVANWMIGAIAGIKSWSNAFVLGFMEIDAKGREILAGLYSFAAKVNIIPGIGDDLRRAAAEASAGAKNARDGIGQMAWGMTLAQVESDKAATSTKKAAGALLNLGDEAKAAKPKLTDTQKEAAQLAKQLKDIAAVPKWQWIASAEEGVPAMLALEEAVSKVPDALKRVGPSLQEVADAEAVAAAAAFELEDALEGTPEKLKRVGQEAKAAGNEIAQKFGDVIRNLPATLNAAFEGGGGLIGAFKSIGVQLGDALAGSMMDRLSKSITAKMAGVSSTVLGGFAGIVAIVGAGLSRMASEDARHAAIAKENARSMAQALKDYEDELKAVSKEYGHLYDAIKRVKLSRVGDLEGMQLQVPLLRQMVDLQGQIADKEREIADLQASLIPSWNDVQAAAEKYGLSIDGAGQKVQQLKITTVSTDLINDWEMLQRAGWDTASMLDGMKDELSAMAQESMKYGTELPAQMKPILQSLLEQGKLTDANGDKLKDLTGLKFGAPVKTEADKISDAIKGLVDKLAEFIAQFNVLAKESETAATAVYEHWRKAPWDGWRQPDLPSPGDPGRPSPGGGGGKAPGYASGGLVMQPTYARIAEGGQPEIVGPVDFMARALAGALSRVGGSSAGSGGRVVVENRIYLDGREITHQVLQHTPGVLASMGVR